MSGILTIIHLCSYTLVILLEGSFKRGSSCRNYHTFKHICVLGSDYSQSVFLNEKEIDCV
jgi:hypothetical protein